MPLRAPEPPEESVAVLRDALGALAQRGQFSARGLRKARPEQLTATAPHAASPPHKSNPPQQFAIFAGRSRRRGPTL